MIRKLVLLGVVVSLSAGCYHATVVTGAMARELASFMGAMAQPVPVTPSGPRPYRDDPPHAEGFRRASEQTPPRCGVTRGGVQRLV